MVLTLEQKHILRDCAEAINARDGEYVFDLSPLGRDNNGELTFVTDDHEIIDYLRRMLALFVTFPLTLREADERLFPNLPEGARICLAACPLGTPEGLVTELTEDKFLVLLSPDPDHGGCFVDTAIATAR